jgi:hypothetical protein
LDNILLSFRPKPSQVPRFTPRSGFQQFFPIYHIRPDKFVFKIIMNGGVAGGVNLVKSPPIIPLSRRQLAGFIFSIF